MNKNNIKSFTFWHSYYEVYRKLSRKNDRLLFLESIILYIFEGEVKDLTQFPIIDVAFSSIKPNLDKSIKQALNRQKKENQIKTKQEPNENQPETILKNVPIKYKEEIEVINRKYKEEGEKEYIYKKPKIAKLGSFGNVSLTPPEIESLNIQGLTGYIDKLSGYMKSTGKTYKDHYATIMRWADKDNAAPKCPVDLKEEAPEDEKEKEKLIKEIEAMKGE